VNGGTTRQYKIFSRLLELGHEVTIVGVFAPREDPYIDELREQGFDVVPLERPNSRLRETLWAIVRKPSILLHLRGKTLNELICAVYWVDLKKMVRDALKAGNHDVLVVIHEYAAWWLEEIETDIPAVIEIQELESPQHLANAERMGGFGGWLRRIAWRRTRSSEQRWLPHFDGIVTMSDEEAVVLEQLVQSPLPPIFAIGNGADTAELAEIGPDPGEGIVLFTGTMMFPPNTNGALWLGREVWPRVLSKVPDARLKIVGRRPPQSVLLLSGSGAIEVTADVPDMKPYFAEADVCLLPMLEGGGTRLKLTEAMAAGRAVVSTTNGATGVDVTDGEELLIADDPQDFADAIVRLLGDRELRAQLGAVGRKKVVEQYDWHSLGDKYAAMLESVVEAHSAVK
jgi:glycosyltransferase involved in cell wall biosynthesis